MCISISICISIYDIYIYIYINIMDDLAVGLIFFKVSLPVFLGFVSTLGIWHIFVEHPAFGKTYPAW